MPDILSIRLPATGGELPVRRPTGADELALLESQGGSEPDRALAFVARLAPDGFDTARLPVCDLDTVLLSLRRILLGDRVTAETRCDAPGCGAKVDIAFGIAAFLAHHQPCRPRLRRWSIAASPARPGWFAVMPRGAASPAAWFRLPTAGDDRTFAGRPDAAASLRRSCIEVLETQPALGRAVEAAMAAMAPLLAGEVAGTCPACQASVQIGFDPRRFVLAEFTARAAFVAEDLHVIAANYHWSEQAILDLPGPRRATYADLARRLAA